MSIRHAAVKHLALTIVVFGCMVAPAAAQQPTPEQVSAIRGSCRSDFISRCSGVQPGGPEAIACLRKNLAQLSPACQTAVSVVTPKPAAPPSAAASAPPAPAPNAARIAVSPAATPTAPPVAVAPAGPPPAMAVPSADQVAAIRASCPSDFAAHCAGVPPGGMEGLACLQRNAARLSAPCRFAVGASPAAAMPPPVAAAPIQHPAAPVQPAATPAARPAAPTPVRAAATPPAPAAALPRAAAGGAPTAQQQAAIRSACQSDFMTRCRGVQPGGADALACLKRNAAQLSPACRTAVGAIGAPAASATAHAVPAAAAPPSQPSAEQQAAIRASCRSDFMARCPGVQPGGADALACLKRNAAQLSSACRTAVSAIGAPLAGAAPAAAAAPAIPTPQQQSAIKNTCRRDFMVNCRGVQPGGPEAFACLQRNAARLSPDCGTALAAINDPGVAATATSTAAAPAAGRAGPGPFPLRRAIRERMMGN